MLENSDSRTVPHRRDGILVRSALCGCLFALPVTGGVLLSPLFRKQLKTITNPQEVMSHAGLCAALGSSVTYWTVECPNVHGWLPYMDTRTSLSCAFSATAGCHLFYPGVFVLLMERGPLFFRMREYSRLTAKCIGAYFFIPHFATIATWGLAVTGVSRALGRK